VFWYLSRYVNAIPLSISTSIMRIKLVPQAFCSAFGWLACCASAKMCVGSVTTGSSMDPGIVTPE